MRREQDIVGLRDGGWEGSSTFIGPDHPRLGFNASEKKYRIKSGKKETGSKCIDYFMSWARRKPMAVSRSSARPGLS